MKELKMTGGARIGHVKATWPLVSMIVTPDSLVIEASLLGRVEFTPEDVIAIKPYEPIRGLGRGIQIVHNVSVYKEKIIFWGSASVAQLLEEISRTGFEANGSESTRLLLS